MRIVFMGTPAFAVPSLKILLDNSYAVGAVVTAPDKPRGRGQRLAPSPIKQLALARNIPVLQPDSLKSPWFIDRLRELDPDLFVVVAFRILPKEVFTIPRRGTFNLHASLLPKYRGPAPINWAIIKGETETGVTTFFIEEGVDTGKIILQARVPIGADETAGELHDKLADVGGEIVLHTVRLIEMGKAVALPQDNTHATLAPKLLKEHCRIDWSKPAEEVHNFIRGISPVPGAFTIHAGQMIKIYRSKVASTGASHYPPGTISHAKKHLTVATGMGTVEILELQLEGKRRLSAEEFLRGHPMEVGERFE